MLLVVLLVITDYNGVLVFEGGWECESIISDYKVSCD